MYLHSGSRKKNNITLGLLVILSIFILTIHFKEGPDGLLHRIQRVSIGITAPLQAGVTKIINSFSSNVNFITDVFNLREENRKLKKENEKLKHKFIFYKEIENENSRLRKLIGFEERLKYRTLPAQIIGKSSNDWQSSIIIDKGYADGLTKNMPVFTSDGLVGQIVQVAPNASQVQLILDQKSGVGVQILSTGETGVLQGQINGFPELEFISKNSEVKVGDEIVTSGLGGVFPKGILVGKVVSLRIDGYSLNKQIYVKPTVDFSKLGEILIITNPPLKPPFAGEEE
ncbi:MAG: rod shape-determining protein MreC [Actinobacteria bacterium]|nr:rod shape-determining protein MreC [Actinomycetota bacterium]